MWGRSEIILIPDLPSPFTICAGNLAIPRQYSGKVKLIGPIVEDNRHHLNDHQSRIKHKLGFGSGKPLVYAAVSGPKIEREILARILIDSLRGLSKQYQIVLSRGEPKGRRGARMLNGIRIYDWIEDQDDFIRASDLVVSRAGHGTIMKSLAYGKPMVLIPIPDHTEQYSNARRASSLHVAEMIDQNRLNYETLESAFQAILETDQYRINAVQISKKAASLHAVAVACDLISDLGRHP